MSYNFSYGAPSASMSDLPLFSQRDSGSNAFGKSPFLASTLPDTGDWMGAFKNVGTPSFMQSGFMPGSPAESGGGGWMDALERFFGTTKAPGWGQVAIGAGQALASTALGFGQYNLAKQKLEESRRQFDMNYGAAKQATNSNLEDRQRARVASNPGAYLPVEQYMPKYGVA